MDSQQKVTFNIPHMKESPSPVLNVPCPFYSCYMEECKVLNFRPLKAILQQESDIILDIKTDKITCFQWIPILNALETDDSLYIIAFRSSGCYTVHRLEDDEDVYQFGKRGSLFTSFTMNSLWYCLSGCLNITYSLSYLELDGIPLGGIVDMFLKALCKNETLRVLSFKNCAITGRICQKVCLVLQNIWNIRELNLTGSKLGASDAEHIASLIRHQKLDRYMEKNRSNMDENQERSQKVGLQVIILQKNQNIGDEGLNLILNEIYDDLWIEVLDMQSCGITDKSASNIIKLALHNRTLQVANFCCNRLAKGVVRRVNNILLKNKPENNTFPSYSVMQLTSKYTKWSSIIPTDSKTNMLDNSNIFSKCFCKHKRIRKFPRSKDLPKRPVSRVSSLDEIEEPLILIPLEEEKEESIHSLPSLTYKVLDYKGLSNNALKSFDNRDQQMFQGRFSTSSSEESQD